MIDVKIAFGLLIIMVLFVVVCAFLGLWLGAYIHHRGVSIGSGSKETFLGKVPEGEIFRLAGADELPAEPKLDISDTLDKTTAARMDRFLSTIMGKA